MCGGKWTNCHSAWMNKPFGPLSVVCAVITGPDGVLLSRRLNSAHMGGKWEFPGGKREVGESPEAALVRELREELGITVEVGPLVYRVQHRYPEQGLIDLSFYLVKRGQGCPQPLASAEIRWFPPHQLAALDMPPANRSLALRIASVADLSSLESCFAWREPSSGAGW